MHATALARIMDHHPHQLRIDCPSASTRLLREDGKKKPIESIHAMLQQSPIRAINPHIFGPQKLDLDVSKSVGLILVFLSAAYEHLFCLR